MVVLTFYEISLFFREPHLCFSPNSINTNSHTMPRVSDEAVKPFSNLRQKVVRKFGLDLFNDFLGFIIEEKPRLWSTDKPSNLPEVCLIYTLAHDLFGFGYTRLEKKWKSPGFLGFFFLFLTISECPNMILNEKNQVEKSLKKS